MKKMLRRALLGGAAVAMMAAGAQAGELEALKAQLEALQARVATMEAQAAQVPAGASLITFERGQQAGIIAENAELFGLKAAEMASKSRGATIAITPTADLPAPVASIELSGYIRGLLYWHSGNNFWDWYDASLDHVDIQARGELNIAATTDTAIGRVTGGIQLRGDMESEAGTGPLTGNVHTFTIRQAWATWQMTDALSLTFGRTGQIATLSNVSSGLLVPNHPFGPDNTRRSQFRITYASGPFNLRFGIEDPSQAHHTNAMPDFAASMGFDMGMIGFRMGGEVARIRSGGGWGLTRRTGYALNAGVDFELGSMGSFNFGGVYTDGLGCDGLLDSSHNGSPGVGCFNSVNNKVEAWGVQGNLSLNVTETTTFNVSAGYFDANSDINVDYGWSVGANIVYRPVDALQFAAEVGYSSVDLTFNPVGSTDDKDEGLIVGLAAWYFF